MLADCWLQFEFLMLEMCSSLLHEMILIYSVVLSVSGLYDGWVEIHFHFLFLEQR